MATREFRGGRIRALASQPFLNRAFTFGHVAVNAPALWSMAGQSTDCCGHHRFNTRSGVPAMELVRQFMRDEDGQDVVEYGLLIATIAIVVLVGISIFGKNIQDWFSILAGRITTNS